MRDVIEHNISSETSGENTSERSGGGEEDDVHPALKEAPMLGDGRFMLEIGTCLLHFRHIITIGLPF